MTDQPDWRAEMLARIPKEVLTGRNRKSLPAYCRSRDFHPTLWEIEQERARRKDTR